MILTGGYQVVVKGGNLNFPPLAYLLNVCLVLIRKPGKLPSTTIEQEYALEYGTDKIEIHTDAIKKGEGQSGSVNNPDKIISLRSKK